MALATTTSTIQYNGTNTANQVCPVPFRFFVNTDLVVQTLNASGVLTTLTLGTHYSVTGADQTNGGSVTILAATPTTTKIQISRDVPETQLVSFTTGDRLPASTLERALDKLTMLVQEVGRGLLRTIRFSDLVPTQPVLTPSSASVLGTDATNTMTFIGSTAATGATPYFLAAPTAGGVPSFVALPSITETRLANDAVSTEKIQNDAVIPSKIGGNPAVGQWVLGSTNGEVVWQLPSSTGIDDNSVTTTKLADDAVTAAKLSESATDDSVRAVTDNHIRNNAVGSAKLRSDATTDANRAVTTNHIRDNAVTGAKIISDAVNDANRPITRDHIRNGAISENKLSGDSSDLNDNARAVVTDTIRNGAVTNAKLATGSVDFAKVSSGMVVGRAYTQSTAVFSLTGNTPQLTNPATNVLPTSTQGLQILTLNYTPKALNNIMVARFYAVNQTGTTALNVGTMIFEGTTCRAFNLKNRPASTWDFFEVSTNIVVATDLSQRSFTARIGLLGATAGTTNLLFINQGSGGALWGGATQLILEVTEYKA